MQLPFCFSPFLNPIIPPPSVQFSHEHYPVGSDILVLLSYDALSSAVRNGVEALGGRFLYVDPTNLASPFTGHGICQEDAESYFNEVVLGENERYSFNPNLSGQAAYAQLLGRFIVDANL